MVLNVRAAQVVLSNLVHVVRVNRIPTVVMPLRFRYLLFSEAQPQQLFLRLIVVDDTVSNFIETVIDRKTSRERKIRS